MSDMAPTPQFEEEIRAAVAVPLAREEFIQSLHGRIMQQSTAQPRLKRPIFFRPAWVAAFVLAVLLVSILAIGPQRVLAAIRGLFGYIPGVGIVDQSAPIRVLAEPVSDRKDGITLAIQSAFLSADLTIITYAMSDLPTEMKPARFGDPECFTPAYLTLPDGNKVEASGSSGGLAPDGTFVHEIRFSGPFPVNFNQATLVFPCLEGTARGKGPEDWQIALAFKPAPENIIVYPATLMSSQSKIENPVPATTEPTAQPKAETEAPTMPAMIVDGDRQEEMVVLSVVEKPDSYWVTWAYPDKLDSDIQINGQLYVVPFNPVLYDANGTELPEPNHETQLEFWKYEESLRNQLSDQDQMKYLGSMHTFIVPKYGVAFPVYAKQNVYERSFPEKEAYAEIEFDGTKVQTSDKPVEINQEIQLGSVKFILRAIEKNQFGGYSFLFDGTEGKVIQCLVDLVGYSTDMSGSSSFNPDDPFHFDQAVMVRQLLSGKLTVRVSHPAVLGDLISFIGSWSPDK
jgi:hypothetical protein